VLDENGEVVSTEENVEQLEILEDKAFMMPTIPYLMFFAKQLPLPNLIATFSEQFVDDNIGLWTELTVK
jgi:hypothetical protein